MGPGFPMSREKWVWRWAPTLRCRRRSRLASEPNGRQQNPNLFLHRPLANGYGPQGKTGHGSFDLVYGADVTKFVSSLARQFFEVMELPHVHSLLDQEEMVHRNKSLVL